MYERPVILDHMLRDLICLRCPMHESNMVGETSLHGPTVLQIQQGLLFVSKARHACTGDLKSSLLHLLAMSALHEDGLLWIWYFAQHGRPGPSRAGRCHGQDLRVMEFRLLGFSSLYHFRAVWPDGFFKRCGGAMNQIECAWCLSFENSKMQAARIL